MSSNLTPATNFQKRAVRRAFLCLTSAMAGFIKRAGGGLVLLALAFAGVIFTSYQIEGVQRAVVANDAQARQKYTAILVEHGIPQTTAERIAESRALPEADRAKLTEFQRSIILQAEPIKYASHYDKSPGFAPAIAACLLVGSIVVGWVGVFSILRAVGRTVGSTS